MDLPKHTADFLQRQRLDRDAPWLVGVSGGLDSVCLLRLLVGARLKNLHVAHLDHGLRGAESDGDREFVRALAEETRLPFHTRQVDVAALAGESDKGLEEAGRRARQRFFAELRREIGAGGVFLAHHADDQAETVLWNLLRGAGLRGAGGMREVVELEVDGAPLPVLRPLLRVPRRELRQYAKRHGLSWREDATNADPEAATRNRLRHDLIPELEKQLGRPVAPALGRFAVMARDEDDFLRLQAESYGLHRDMKLPIKPLLPLHRALQRRIILLWLDRVYLENVPFETVEAIIELLEVAPDGTGKNRVRINDILHVARSKMHLIVRSRLSKTIYDSE
jgi:tRNA(Ile)-lysidine synthase